VWTTVTAASYAISPRCEGWCDRQTVWDRQTSGGSKVNFIFYIVYSVWKNIFEIEFYSGRNPRSFGSMGGVCVCVWIEIVAATVFCSVKAPYWMISEAILIPKIYARLHKIASNFFKFSGEASRRRSVRDFTPLPDPPFQNSWIRPCRQTETYSLTERLTPTLPDHWSK